MKPLAIIKSCHKNLARRSAVRNTWLPSLTWDRMFVLGNQPPGVGRWVNEPNTLLFLASDEFKNIAPKVKAALDWGLHRGYDLFLICDDDTYVVPERLEALVREKSFDYIGCYRADGGYGYPLPYIQASGMLLSGKAAAIVSESSEMVDAVPDDIAVGRALYGKVEFTNDSRFHPGPVPCLGKYTVTTHKCGPDLMAAIHKAYSNKMTWGLDDDICFE